MARNKPRLIFSPSKEMAPEKENFAVNSCSPIKTGASKSSMPTNGEFVIAIKMEPRDVISNHTLSIFTRRFVGSVMAMMFPLVQFGQPSTNSREVQEPRLPQGRQLQLPFFFPAGDSRFSCLGRRYKGCEGARSGGWCRQAPKICLLTRLRLRSHRAR